MKFGMKLAMKPFTLFAVVSKPSNSSTGKKAKCKSKLVAFHGIGGKSSNPTKN